MQPRNRMANRLNIFLNKQIRGRFIRKNYNQAHQEKPNNLTTNAQAIKRGIEEISVSTKFLTMFNAKLLHIS